MEQKMQTPMNKHKANLYVQSSGRVSVNSVIYFA